MKQKVKFEKLSLSAGMQGDEASAVINYCEVFSFSATWLQKYGLWVVEKLCSKLLLVGLTRLSITPGLMCWSAVIEVIHVHDHAGPISWQGYYIFIHASAKHKHSSDILHIRCSYVLSTPILWFTFQHSGLSPVDIMIRLLNMYCNAILFIFFPYMSTYSCLDAGYLHKICRILSLFSRKRLKAGLLLHF